MLWRGPMGGGAASGRIGAMVASRNAGGQYVRARVTPTNPRTSFQTEIRNSITQLSNGWNSILTTEQRFGWTVYGFNTTFRNRLGDTIQLSGISAYVRSNASRIQAGLERIDDAPTTFDTGDAGNDNTLTCLANASSGSPGTLTWAGTPTWNSSVNGGTLLLYVSRPQNAGISFFKGPYRLAASITPNPTANHATFGLPFATGPAGSQLFFQTRVTLDDGRLSGILPGQTFPS